MLSILLSFLPICVFIITIIYALSEFSKMIDKNIQTLSQIENKLDTLLKKQDIDGSL